jgi:transcriptional regulator with XRE-family HTH domain
MTKLGATDSDLAQAFDISTNTISAWKRKYPEFMDALQLGKDIANQEVVRSLYARATGYKHTAVRFFVIDGQIKEKEYIEHYPPDVKAQEFWLTNRMAEEWKRNHEDDDKREGVHINITGGLPDKL